MKVWICAAVALACAIGMSGTASAAKKKPFHETAKTCTKYSSPGWVKSETGVVGTAQKGPPGQCHFVVGGVKDAFQVGIHALKSPKAALALLQQGWNVLSADSGSTTAWVSGLGTKAFLLDGGLSGAYVVRGDEFIDLQWGAPVTFTHAQAIATLRALLAKVPK